jgi:hypothetical protein
MRLHRTCAASIIAIACSSACYSTPSVAPPATTTTDAATQEVADAGNVGDAPVGDVTVDVANGGDAPSSDADAGRDCTPGDVRSCYPGPAGTKGVGRCREGVQQCASDGMSWSACAGHVVPEAAENCDTIEDDDCNGSANETCACSPGATRACYTGGAGTLDVGACHAGTQICLADGSGFGPCDGEVLPSAERCATAVDDDCDGFTNESGSDCTCQPGTLASCYSGPAGTVDVGICRAGVKECAADGSGYGPCIGEILPRTEVCGNTVDDDCDSEINEDGANCVCKLGDTRACYTGPNGTAGVGICKEGTVTCLPTADGYASNCVGQTLPSWENCDDDGTDDDCSGSAATVCHTFKWSIIEHEGLPSTLRELPNGDLLWLRRRGVSVDTRRLRASDGALLATLPTVPLSATLTDVDAAGNIFIAGSCSGTTVIGSVSLQCGSGSSYVLKMNSTGTAQWGKTWPRSYPYYEAAFGVGSGGHIAMVVDSVDQDFGDGNPRNGTALVRLAPDGTLAWSALLSASLSSSMSRPAVDGAGAVIAGIIESQPSASVFSAAGQLAFKHSPTSSGLPAGAWNPGGSYWVASGNKIQRMDAAHNVTDTIDGSFDRIEPSPNGGLITISAFRYTQFSPSAVSVASRDIGGLAGFEVYVTASGDLYFSGIRFGALSFQGGAVPPDEYVPDSFVVRVGP